MISASGHLIPKFPEVRFHRTRIFNMTYEPGANKYRKGLEKEGIFIKSYSDLLAEARRYNDDLFKMYEDISMKKNNKSDK